MHLIGKLLLTLFSDLTVGYGGVLKHRTLSFYVNSISNIYINVVYAYEVDAFYDYP